MFFKHNKVEKLTFVLDLCLQSCVAIDLEPC